MINGSALTDVRVLITRPQAQAHKWQQCVNAAGAATQLLPLLDIVPVATDKEQAIKNIILDFDQYQVAIFVSQNAVHYGLDWLDRYWPQLPLGIEYFAVGKSTEAMLTDQHLLVSAADSAMNSETLLALPALQDVAEKKVVIFRGCGGRPYLGEQLQQRGARVDYCELYERRLPKDAHFNVTTLTVADEPGVQDVISVHSGETLNNWHQVLMDAGRQQWQVLPLLVPGERVEVRARELGFSCIITAENATDAAMLSALCDWQAGQ